MGARIEPDEFDDPFKRQEHDCSTCQAQNHPRRKNPEKGRVGSPADATNPFSDLSYHDDLRLLQKVLRDQLIDEGFTVGLSLFAIHLVSGLDRTNDFIDRGGFR